MFDKPNKSDQKQTEAHTFKNDNTFAQPQRCPQQCIKISSNNNNNSKGGTTTSSYSYNNWQHFATSYSLHRPLAYVILPCHTAQPAPSSPAYFTPCAAKKVALKWSSSNDMQTFGPKHTIYPHTWPHLRHLPTRMTEGARSFVVRVCECESAVSGWMWAISICQVANKMPWME